MEQLKVIVSKSNIREHPTVQNIFNVTAQVYRRIAGSLFHIDEITKLLQKFHHP